MLELVAQMLLMILALAFLAAFAFTVVKSRRWRREHGEPKEPPLVDPELTRFGTPFSETRTEAARLVRDGRAAEDPATAYVAHRLAERELPLSGNPWVSRGHVLIVLSQVPLISFQSLASGAEAPFFLGFLLVVMVAAITFGVLSERHMRRRRANAERALELNRDLAAEFDRSQDSQKEVPE